MYEIGDKVLLETGETAVIVNLIKKNVNNIENWEDSTNLYLVHPDGLSQAVAINENEIIKKVK